jgi:hypothetical protein
MLPRTPQNRIRIEVFNMPFAPKKHRQPAFYSERSIKPRSYINTVFIQCNRAFVDQRRP